MISDVEMTDTDVVDLRDLRSFLTVVRTGSFTTAGAELGYTQSAISQHVAALESELGVTLLHRRPVRPTHEGERLAEHAARIVLRLDVARSELAQNAARPAVLRVAASPLAAPDLLGQALRAVRAEVPSLGVTIDAMAPADAVARVADGRADIALVDGVTAPDNPLALLDAGLLQSSVLAQEPLVVGMAHDHPLARRSTIDLGTVIDAPWIDAPALTVDPARFARRSPVTEPAHERLHYSGTDLATLLSLVGAGLGLALLPASACTNRADVVGVLLDAPPLVHRTEAMTLRSADAQRDQLLGALRARSRVA